MISTLQDIFKVVRQLSASDVIFTPGVPPAVWVAGQMRLLEAPALTPEEITALFLPLLQDEQRRHLREQGDLDCGIGAPGLGRLRVNLHQQRGTLSAAVRFIPHEVPALSDLGLPARVQEFTRLLHGLVLVTGGAATGKTTTLAAMIDDMNRRCAYHIITLEDPIEYTFRHGHSIIEQREIGVDAPSFASALRHVVRQRPDVVLIGEMRDLETISAALTAAETGHLVLASLHTNSAVATVDRIIDAFPGDRQAQVRVQLASTLQGVVCQALFFDRRAEHMTPAVEIMVPTPAIRRAIRDHETHLLSGMVETGMAHGMQSMDMAISRLAADGRISIEEALAKAQDPEKVRRQIAA